MMKFIGGAFREKWIVLESDACRSWDNSPVSTHYLSLELGFGAGVISGLIFPA
jgi:hypothetical protein